MSEGTTPRLFVPVTISSTAGPLHGATAHSHCCIYVISSLVALFIFYRQSMLVIRLPPELLLLKCLPVGFAMTGSCSRSRFRQHKLSGHVRTAQSMLHVRPPFFNLSTNNGLICTKVGVVGLHALKFSLINSLPRARINFMFFF